MVSMRTSVAAFLWSIQHPSLVSERLLHKPQWRSVSMLNMHMILSL